MRTASRFGSVRLLARSTESTKTWIERIARVACACLQRRGLPASERTEGHGWLWPRRRPHSHSRATPQIAPGGGGYTTGNNGPHNAPRRKGVMVVKGALFGPAGRYLRRLSPSYLMMTFIRQRIHVAIQRVHKSRYSEARIFLRTALAPITPQSLPPTERQSSSSCTCDSTDP